jgi:hypothetical protein
MSINIKKFNMNMIKDDEIIVLIGKRNTGKSYLTRDLMFSKKHIPVGTVISPTENANKFYSNFVPPLFIHDEYKISITSNFMGRQKKLKKRIMKGGKGINNSAYLILDDCLYDDTIKKDKVLREIFMNGRHWDIMLILILQFSMGIPPKLRGNVDWIFILRENIISNRKRLYEHYAGMFPTFDIFCSVMDECTNDYECLVVHCSSRSNKLEEQVYWYKADSHGDFRTCIDEAWKFSEENYIEESEQNEEAYSVDEYIKSKRKGPHFKIKKTL